MKFFIIACLFSFSFAKAQDKKTIHLSIEQSVIGFSFYHSNPDEREEYVKYSRETKRNCRKYELIKNRDDQYTFKKKIAVLDHPNYQYFSVLSKLKITHLRKKILHLMY